jgi:hypothetical protein
MITVNMKDWSLRKVAFYVFFMIILPSILLVTPYCDVKAGVFSVSATKISTTISCSVSPSEVVEGKSITVSGTIHPILPGKMVNLTYTKPNASNLTRMVVTIFDGFYTDSFAPDATGVWSVSASWEGDSLFDGASSSLKSFTVKKKSGCLIATATYGSELSPQVQFLRRFRDNKVLTTFAGSSFMTVFNTFYYSFSPSVASTISGDENLRGILKVILYPLMGILQLSSTVFSLFSFLPELGVVLAGLVASMLIAVVYILPWVLLLYLLKKFKLSVRTTSWMSLVWVGSLMSLALAEVTRSSLLMMVSAGTCVLATMCLTTLAMTRAITKLSFP